MKNKLHLTLLSALLTLSSFIKSMGPQPQQQLSSAQIVERLVAKKEEELKARYKPEEILVPPGEELETFDPVAYSAKAIQQEVKTIKCLYQQFEEQLGKGNKFLPTYEVAGSLSYAMPIDEIIHTVKTKFKEMHKNNQIITKNEFQTLDPNKWYNKGENLTRIWGAEYLAKRGYNVPKYIIVVDDPNNIKIKIVLRIGFPSIEYIENGTVYAEKIIGEPAAADVRPIGSDHGYTDYSDSGNILRTQDDSLYFVDTEYKSFYDARPEPHIFEGIGQWQKKSDYLKERFELINKIDGTNKIIEFSVLAP